MINCNISGSNESDRKSEKILNLAVKKVLKNVRTLLLSPLVISCRFNLYFLSTKGVVCQFAMCF